ncbi:hypothetical protein ACQ4PT_064519 [Festuca glaucescens]
MAPGSGGIWPSAIWRRRPSPACPRLVCRCPLLLIPVQNRHWCGSTLGGSAEAAPSSYRNQADASTEVQPPSICASTMQVKELNFQGYEVILVTSGAVGVGRQRLKYRKLINSSFADLQNPQMDLDGKACAAVGQSDLMAIYDTLFSQRSLSINICYAVFCFSCLLLTCS